MIYFVGILNRVVATMTVQTMYVWAMHRHYRLIIVVATAGPRIGSLRLLPTPRASLRRHRKASVLYTHVNTVERARGRA